MPEIVFDTSVLSNYSLGDAMPILEKMYGGSATITIFITAEIRAGVRAGHAGLRQADEAIRDEILALMIKNGFYAPVKSLKSLLD